MFRRCVICGTNKKKTAAFKAEVFSVDTKPVTQARQTDIPEALTIIKTLLPNLSTVKEQMMPPRMIHA